MRSKLIPALATAALCWGGGSPCALAIVIDDFTQGTGEFLGPAQFDQPELDPAHVIGGARRIEIFRAGSTMMIDPHEGFRFHSTEFGYFNLTYGGAVPLGGVDLTQSGHDRFLIRFGDIGAGFHPFGLYVNPSSDGRSLYLLDAWDDIILESRYSNYPTTFTTVDAIIVRAFRNPANTAFEIKSIATGRRELPGDFNYDGVVDFADLDAWQRTAGINTFDGSTLGFVASTDANEDGYVNGADLLVWQRNLGAGNTQPIPEPAAAMLLALGALVLLVRRGAMPALRRGPARAQAA